MLTVYQYIAANDPVGAEAVCTKYGYVTQNVQSPDDMAECLQALVGAEGLTALNDIVNLHPDKDLIMETFGGAPSQTAPDQAGCGCSKCKDKTVAQQYVDAAQGNGGFSIAGINQGGLFILGSILILGLVIVSSHKS